MEKIVTNKDKLRTMNSKEEGENDTQPRRQSLKTNIGTTLFW